MTSIMNIATITTLTYTSRVGEEDNLVLWAKKQYATPAVNF